MFKSVKPCNRRHILLGSVAFSFVLASGSSAKTIRGSLPWEPREAYPPNNVKPGRWIYFTQDEAAAVETLVNYLIPPDEHSIGGKDAGCAVFIDRQLAGPYGTSEFLYMRGPFAVGTPQQGSQSSLTPAVVYKQSLKSLSSYIQANFSVKNVSDLSSGQVNSVLTGLETGKTELTGANGKMFFSLLLKDTREGFFSDPIYGGNRDMASWKMIGFPGARYDLRDWVHRHNEKYPLGPVSIAGV